MHIQLDASINELLQSGTVIPAHPLALHENLTLDTARQKQLTKYYVASGAGGVAVGVHTTQFEIRKPQVGLYETVLRLAAETIEELQLQKSFIRVAGICGPVAQAVKEAELAVKHGYHLGLLSMGGLSALDEKQLIERARAVADVMPLFGFYLQPAVGGRFLSYDFWRQFAEIENVYAIKIAAFNRYQTLDVVRAVCDSSRMAEIALYTGNDDNIVADLLTPYRFPVNGRWVEKRFAGGLLGHWAVWTSKAVELLAEIKTCIANNYQGAGELLARGIQVTDMNAVIFDAENAFRGCIAGIHEVLRRQGLLSGTWCLEKEEVLSPGQAAEIDRLYRMYPMHTDEDFVKKWLNSVAAPSI